ncbi:hypothetical protein [Plantactinospora sp. CA-290183]|uniref:hypothetical protein n=1 Tax=Plantactinospora sp. CA-290183 TaxID=3240006 RepID=UPI003D8DE19F
MAAEHDGPQIVGIDLDRRRSVIVRMTEVGERLDSVRIDNDPMVLAIEIVRAGGSSQVVLEATYGWYWAVDVLQDVGAQVHLAHPLGVKGFARRMKNDLGTHPIWPTCCEWADCRGRTSRRRQRKHNLHLRNHRSVRRRGGSRSSPDQCSTAP